MIDRQVPEDTDLLAAFIGTWLGEGVEVAIASAYPNALVQRQVSLTLEGDHGTYRLSGHPDVILAEDGILLDGRTLYVVQNQLNRIAKINLAPNLRSGRVVTRITSPDFSVPTTIAELGRRLYAVNARFGTPSPSTADYWVTQVRK